jgi:acyl-coenzyme A thioesterase PaaI-like protein
LLQNEVKDMPDKAIQDDYCFACGKDNPIGMHLDFHIEGNTFKAVHTVSAEYQSYQGVVHGGIITTMLDEAMGGYLCAQGQRVVTARIDVRYRAITPVGVPLTITGQIKSQRGRFIEMAGTIALPDGMITAEGTAKMAVVE